MKDLKSTWKNLQFKTKRGSVALMVWPQRLMKETSYFHNSDNFQWFCENAFCNCFTLFVTASKWIELQKPNSKLFSRAFRSSHNFLYSNQMGVFCRGNKSAFFFYLEVVSNTHSSNTHTLTLTDMHLHSCSYPFLWFSKTSLFLFSYISIRLIG